MTIAELERQLESLKFTVERLQERVAHLERTKSDKMQVYEYWDEYNARKK